MGQHLLPEGAAPSTPSTGYVSVYAKADGLLYSKDDAGVETQLGGNVALGLTAGKAQQVDQTVSATVRAATTDFTGESIEGTLSNSGVAITAFHGVAGVTYKRKCLGAGDITAGAGLTILQGGASITTAAGDTFEVYMLTSTTCEVRNYVRAVVTHPPCFSARQSVAQTIATNTLTRVKLQTEEFDTANAFDSATNYRFAPLVAGYYQISGQVTFSSATNRVLATLYKGGNRFKDGFVNTNGAAGNTSGFSTLVYLDGTGAGADGYVELWCYQASGGNLPLVIAPYYNYFQGFLARAA